MSYPKLKITFLGTGTSSGVPMIGCHCEVCRSSDVKDKRLRSSILVQSALTTLVVDTTPDFRYQMLREKIDKLDAVIFTHPHKDHIAGLDDIRAYNFFLKRPMEIFANSLTEAALKREFFYIFAEKKYPGLPNVNLNLIVDNPFWVGDILVEPVFVHHLNMPVLGFKFNGFTYITDANRIDEIERDKIKRSHTIVLNALRKEQHISHYNLKEAVEIVDDLQIPNAFFTHISHQMGKHEEVSKCLPDNRKLAWDRLTLHI
ncbi:MAG: MBL fold metallo-hydrolase [Chitinophagaceae bacterium]|nr:MBL fold metallo-hydrolase [Chitinophagaceae bacterium]